MAQEERLDINKTVIRLGLKLGQHYNSPLIGRPIRWLNGSDAPTYRETSYIEINEAVDPNGRLAVLPIAEADPNARLVGDYIQRFKKNAVIISSGRMALREVLRESGGDLAVVVSIGDILAAGRMPHGLYDLGAVPETGALTVTAALREGTSDFSVGMGALVEDEGKVVITEDLHIEAQHIPISAVREYSYIPPRLF